MIRLKTKRRKKMVYKESNQRLIKRLKEGWYFLTILMLLMTGCDSSFKYKVEKTTNALTVFQDSVKLQIEIIDHSIVHVTKSLANGSQSTLPDYVTVLDPQGIDWKYKESKDQLTISTESLKIIVNSDGTIEYQDSEGKSLVAETNDLSYINPKGKEAYDVSQAFVAGDEALYGLGQFQSGIMNWKHVPVRLQQYNQEIAIPFFLSTKGYGIYWHNYSITDFNPTQNEIGFPKINRKESAEEEEAEVVVTEKENVAEYATVIDQEKNIRETVFTPEKSGEYCFMVDSDKKGRMRGEIMVSFDGDTIINYSTIWVPMCYSGKKYLEAGKEYKVVFQNTGAKTDGRLFYNEPDYNKTVLSSTVGEAIEYYFVQGVNPQETLSTYQELTGKAPMFPKSAYGFWQCRERYHTQDEILENAREMREREIPFDNIVQDWFYWPEGEKGPEWDRAKYPDPKGMADELKALNLKLMVSVWPAINNKAIIEKYDLDMIGGGNKVDVHDPGVRERFYRMLSDSMFQIGVNSIWLDGTEPGGRPESDMITAAGPNDAVFNAYCLLVTQAVYEGRRKEFPDERVFNLTRSAYAGQQRFGATSWSGDVESSWEQLAEQIPAGLNFTMAGVPYWTHDIGGFFREEASLNPEFKDQYTDKEFIELLARWFQFGTFSPVFRIHGYKSETEIWRYGQEFEQMARKFIDLRYQLMPYIYSEARKVTQEGHSMMSPLAYYYPEDQKTWEIGDQLFFGESMMVGFVTEYKQRQKEIYLPEGDWFDFWTDAKSQGGTTVDVDAAFDSTPIFVRAGSIIPMGPKVQYATQETDEPLRIKVYPGNDADYILYLDDSESYDYENGEYSELIINYSEESSTLKITKGVDGFTDFDQNPMDLIIEKAGVEDQMKVIFKGEEVSLKL